MWRLPLLGLTGLIGLTLFALPATGTLTAENVADRSGTDQAYLKRDDLADDLVLVADDDDDDTNSKNTRTKNTKTRQSKNSKHSKFTKHSRNSKVSNDNTRSNVTAVTRDRDRSRGDKTRDWTRDGGKLKRDWSANHTNDRSKNDTRAGKRP